MQPQTINDKKINWFRKITFQIIIVIVITFLLSIFGFEVSRHLGYFLMAFPYAYFIFAINYYWFLNQWFSKQWNTVEYICISVFTALISFLPMSVLILSAIGMYRERYIDEIIITGLVYFSITILFTIYYYVRKKKDKDALRFLRKELGKSEADLKLIQSQINPHFLFNVMNSIYGLAIQENAEKTAESVQRLSSMMRFMLFENQQEQILLSRDLIYLKQYIDIQSLRIDQSDQVKLEYDIPDVIDNLYISPMLLIPFVENAFKHGISMANPSWIKINAHVVDQQLKFSVYNSIHKLQGTDLERSESGIGLENVKARLDLHYPNKHMLIIEQNQQEYFVFLTIELNTLEDVNDDTNS